MELDENVIAKVVTTHPKGNRNLLYVWNVIEILIFAEIFSQPHSD